MDLVLGASYGLLTKVINKLSDQLVADYVSSSELGLNFQKIEIDLLHTQGLLHEAQQRDMRNNLVLQSLLQKLSKKADDAEDALDVLHYFKIQDELDGTRDADLDLGDGLSSQVQHVRHAFRHNIGNWFSCFTCCHSQDNVVAATGNTDKAKPQNDDSVDQAEKLPMSDSGSDEHAEKLPFDRVAMSNKIKQLIEELHSLCEPITKQLKISTNNHPQRVIGATPERPITSSTIPRNSKFCGRDAIFEKIIGDLTGGTYSKTLSVLPIVGPGGIGKTTFTQHLFNDERIKDFFLVRIWVCVSKFFDVLNLTREIYSCIPASQDEDSKQEKNTTNLSQLHESIARRLKSKRFLLVLDDIWECKKGDWETLLAPFGKGETKGNMVLVTTRMPKLANKVKDEEINPINLRGLEPDEFWKFFQDCVFGEVKDEQEKDDLIDIARAISDKLKCSPLAAKTVGSLLRNNKSREHWIGILNKKKWENLQHSDDDNIMPALNISYDYLPVHLKQCFSYCALFPEDHRFGIQELTRFWDAIGITDISGQSAEDLVNELVDYGFLIKQDDNYMLHDLLHKLSQQVSSQECVNISSEGFIADNVAPSVRHVSITLDNISFENIEEEMKKLKGRIDIGNLRTLMIFAGNRCHEYLDLEYNLSRRYHNFLKDTFNEIKDLRVLYIPMPSLESLPYNFLKLIHLRYLKIETLSKVFPCAISRFYHLKYLILKSPYYTTISNVPKDFNRLVNLRYVKASNEFHSSIPGVGKMKCLEVLKEFHVKKQSVGFELAELGKLTKLTGELRIHGLEKVKTKKEAEEALLKDKSKLETLTFEFSRTEQTAGQDAIEGLRPHPNLAQLKINGNNGVTGPSWLGCNICVTSLKSLCLSNISWDVLPPFGRLPLLEYLELCKIHGLRQLRLDSDGVVGSFKHLKEIIIDDMPDLVEWIGGDNSHLFSKLGSVDLDKCPNLTTLPLSDCNAFSTEGKDIKWFPHLRQLHIRSCPMLSHLPPIPYTPTLTVVWIVEHGPAGSYLSYDFTELKIKGYSGALVFENMGEVTHMTIEAAPHILLTDLLKLCSLRELNVTGDMFSGEVGDGVVIPSVQKVVLREFHATGKSLPNVFKCFPALSELIMYGYQIDQGGIVLQFPPSRLLHKIEMFGGKNWILSTEGEGAFGGLTSLQSLSIRFCDNIFSQWLSLAEASEAINLFPASIRDLRLEWVPDKMSMALFSNLTSINRLTLKNFNNLTVHGFNPLISRSLKELKIIRCGSIAADLLALPKASWKLEYLCVDNISAVLVDPICRRLSTTLRRLSFDEDETIERFTEEQGEALQLFTALEKLKFLDCMPLQSLPEAIGRLCTLKKLRIIRCYKIRCLPKCGLPTSLEFLKVVGCSDELCKELEDLRETRLNLEIQDW